MIYIYFDNETCLWCVGCKIWRGGSWGNDEYKNLSTGLVSKGRAINESKKYKYNLKTNDYERIKNGR